MGGLCSKSPVQRKGYSSLYANGDVDYSKSNLQSGLKEPQVKETVAKQVEEPIPSRKSGASGADDFYDGIPRFTRGMSQKSRSVRSTQAAVAKVSEVSSRLGRAGTLGLGKAIDVLDTLGSSMTNLNASSSFVPAVTAKGNKLSILAFEVANTIVKGSNLMQSLSERNVRHLKEVVLPSDGVQHLISNDIDELLGIVATDKRDDLKIFSGEVVRFGNRSKDPQWHNLDRYFEKISGELTPQKDLKEEAELVIEQLMVSVQFTAELYQELQILDRFEQDYWRKLQEQDNSASNQKGDSLAILRAELKSQRKQVRSLKKKSLWSRSLEEVMEKLVDVVHYLILEIYNAFGSTDHQIPEQRCVRNHQRLGPAGLALHYANIVMQIDTLVARSSSMPPNTRDALYQNMPPNIKSSLRSKLQSFHVKEELTVTEIKAEMEKTLQWLVPIATNTAKAHHGFGWVGEWANTGSETNRNSAASTAEVIRIETLYHADKDKTEAYILEQLLWLQHLFNRSKSAVLVGGMRSSTKSPISTAVQKANHSSKHEAANILSLTMEEQKLLEDSSAKKRTQRISKSEDFDSEQTRLRKHDRLSKSCSYSHVRESKAKVSVKRLPSALPIIGFGKYKERALDVIDRVETVR